MTGDALSDFAPTTYAHGGRQRDVLRLGSGPAVVVLEPPAGVIERGAGLDLLVSGARFCARGMVGNDRRRDDRTEAQG